MQSRIVGAFFRPPAKAILECLPAATPLVLRAEPTNEYDANAIKVCISTADIPPTALAAMEADLSGFGFAIDDILAQEEWHLGYIPRQETHMWHPILDRVRALLSFNMRGEASVSDLA